MSSLFSRAALKAVKPAQAEFAKFFKTSAINYRMMNVGEVHDRHSVFVYVSHRKREQSDLHRSIRSYYKNGSGNIGGPGGDGNTCDDTVPKRMYDDLLERYGNLEKKLGEKESQLNLANNTIIELRMILGFRTEIEALEVFLWPPKLSKKTNRLEVWADILTSVEPEFTSSAIIMEFRKRLSEKNLSVNFFIRKCLLKFYEQSSTLGGHKIKFPNWSKVTKAVVENVLDYLGLPSHTAYVSSVELLLEPLESVQ